VFEISGSRSGTVEFFVFVVFQYCVDFWSFKMMLQFSFETLDNEHSVMEHSILENPISQTIGITWGMGGGFQGGTCPSDIFYN